MVVAPFDLFYLLVENVFGSIFVSGIGIAAILFLIGMLSKMSALLNYMIVFLFLMTFSIGYVGGFATMILGSFALFYFFRGLINFVTSVS